MTQPRGRIAPPSATFIAIATGAGNSCGIKTDAHLACWGTNTEGQSSPPSGRFTSLMASARYACAVDDLGAVTCWGEMVTHPFPTPPGYLAVAGSATEVCVVAVDSTIVCSLVTPPPGPATTTTTIRPASPIGAVPRFTG